MIEKCQRDWLKEIDMLKPIFSLSLMPCNSSCVCDKKPSALPYAVKPNLEAENSSFSERKQIDPVKLSEWAVAIVPVLKHDKSFRVCEVYKLVVKMSPVPATVFHC